jgi:hypothetical protein
VKRIVLEKMKTRIEFVEVINLEFDMEDLEITILVDGAKLDVRFDSPIGFRVLDEGDLLEFWPQCSSPNGWLYKIIDGGWLEQESKRNGFLSDELPNIGEYFIIGTNYCVGVISVEDPTITESIR